MLTVTMKVTNLNAKHRARCMGGVSECVHSAFLRDFSIPRTCVSNWVQRGIIRVSRIWGLGSVHRVRVCVWYFVVTPDTHVWMSELVKDRSG